MNRSEWIALAGLVLSGVVGYFGGQIGVQSRLAAQEKQIAALERASEEWNRVPTEVARQRENLTALRDMVMRLESAVALLNEATTPSAVTMDQIGRRVALIEGEMSRRDADATNLARSLSSLEQQLSDLSTQRTVGAPEPAAIKKCVELQERAVNPRDWNREERQASAKRDEDMFRALGCPAILSGQGGG